MRAVLVLTWLGGALLAAAAGAGDDTNTTEHACAARKANNSYVCVCNSTYCDNVVREIPSKGRYVAYTTSKAGLRFKKSSGTVAQASSSVIQNIISSVTGDVVLSVNTSETFQTVEGFGGAVTDSAAVNWLNLSRPLRDSVVRNYFGRSGLEYNMLRVPIGGSDFSERAYAYNELPENDAKLSNYSLSFEDTEYKLPLIRAALAVNTSAVHVVATTWSPPLWMKTNGAWTGESRLKTEYYQTYADYHLKFIEKYLEQGVKVWAVTTTNEPVNGVIPFARFNSLGWTPSAQAQWVVKNLGPTLRNSALPDVRDVKILAVDDQRYSVPLWMHSMVSANSSVLDYLSGVAVHYYGDFVPAELISWTHDHYPQLFILATEGCEGSKPWQLEKVVLGSWHRAANYITDIMQDLNNWVVGWIDWNLCLNASGGPNWAGNNVDSPIIVFPERDEFVKQPMFYAMGHFSKFIPRGSRRVGSKIHSLRSVDHVAFLTPTDTIVLVLYNSGVKRTVQVAVDGGRRLSLVLPADAVVTLELPAAA